MAEQKPSLRGGTTRQSVETNREIQSKTQPLIPKLRFKEFDGEWESLKLYDLSSLITKGTTPKSFTKGGVNYIKIEGLKGIHINKKKCLYIDEDVHLKELKRSILHNMDILFAIAGATVGKVGVVTSDILPANTNQALAIIRLKDKKNLNFILQVLQSRVMKKYIYQSVSVGAQPNLNLEQIGNFRFNLPSLPEQQKIASFLSTVDEKIQQLTKKKSLLKQYKKGVMQQLFSGELRFKEFTNEFEENRLSHFLVRHSKNNKDEEFGINDILSLSSKYGIVDRRELLQDTYSNVNHLNYIKTRLNDFVYAKSISSNAPFGVFKANLCRDGLLSTLYYTFKVKENADPLFLEYYFSNPYRANNFLRKYVLVGDRYITADSDYILSGKLKISTLPEQQKIANYLSAIDTKIETVNQQIEKTQEFKKGLLQQMFV